MDCREFRHLLARYVSGRLPASRWADADTHQETCTRCRAIVATLAPPESTPEENEAFVRAVLARTTGPACGPAVAQLGSFVDGDLLAGDAALVAAHLEHCGSCRRLHDAMLEFRIVLPEMAAIDPGPAFTESVIRATTLPRAEVSGWMDWLADWWARQLARPRLALEGAYVGSLVLVLLFWAPSAPLGDVPPRALALAKTNPVEAAMSLAPEGVPAGADGIQGLWHRVGGWPIVGRLREQTSRLQARRLQGQQALGEIWRHGRGVGGAALTGDLPEASLQLRYLNDDLEGLWKSLGSDGSPAADAVPVPVSEPAAAPGATVAEDDGRNGP